MNIESFKEGEGTKPNQMDEKDYGLMDKGYDPEEGIPKEVQNKTVWFTDPESFYPEDLEKDDPRNQEQISKEYNIHENLLTKEKGQWYACGVPVSKYIQERIVEKKNIEKDGYSIWDINFLSKISGAWHVLYHGNQLTVQEWKNRIKEEQKRTAELRAGEAAKKQEERDDYLYGRN